jgi:AcrR family transcriptional regulator
MDMRSDIENEGPAPRWQRRKEARPAEILDSALTEFVSRGYKATRLEDIAKRAGCTKGTIFLYYASKEELFKELVRQTVLPRLQQAEELFATHRGTYRELLIQLLRLRWENMVNCRMSGLPKLMFAEAHNFPELAKFHFDEVIARSQALIQRALSGGIEAGEFREHDTEYVSRLALSPIVMAALWKHSFEPHAAGFIDPQRYFDTSLDLLLRGIERPAQEERRA